MLLVTERVSNSSWSCADEGELKCIFSDIMLNDELLDTSTTKTLLEYANKINLSWIHAVIYLLFHLIF